MGRATLTGCPMKTVFNRGRVQKTIPVLGKVVQPPVKVGV
jgi:hypothetical protein